MTKWLDAVLSLVCPPESTDILHLNVKHHTHNILWSKICFTKFKGSLLKNVIYIKNNNNIVISIFSDIGIIKIYSQFGICD